MYYTTRQESGRSMVEMLGVLAVIGVLSVGGIAGYKVAMTKHKANELLNEASKRAVVVAAKIAAGQFNASTALNEFGSEKVQGVSFTSSYTNGATTFDLILTWDANSNKNSICNQMKNIAGENGVPKIETNCDKITYNVDMSASEASPVASTCPSDTEQQADGTCIKDDDETKYCTDDSNCPQSQKCLEDEDLERKICKCEKGYEWDDGENSCILASCGGAYVEDEAESWPCPDGFYYCNAETNRCSQTSLGAYCEEEEYFQKCGSDAPYCNPITYTCTSEAAGALCQSDSDCGDGYFCGDGSYHRESEANRTCYPETCDPDLWVDGGECDMKSRPFCSAETSKCVDTPESKSCEALEDCGEAYNLYCNAETNRCSRSAENSECWEDGDCCWYEPCEEGIYCNTETNRCSFTS